MSEQKYSPYNLIVNFLPQNLTDEEFNALFNRIGPVKSSKVIRDKTTMISYGFGFVEYVDENDSSKAIEGLDGLTIQNKRVKVAYARQGDNIKGANVYIKYLPKNFDSHDLEKLFSPYGAIISARVLLDQHTGLSRGVGFVLFNTRDEATGAVENLNGKAPPGYTQALSVKFAEDNKAQKMQQHALMMGLLPGAFRNNALLQQNALALSQHRNRMQTSTQSVAGGLLGTYNGTSPLSQVADQNSLGGGFQNGEYVLFVYNIGTDTDERALWQLFQPYGAIKKIAVVQDKVQDKNKGKNYGFVTMFDYQEALLAIQHLNGLTFAEKPLQVSLKKAKK